MEPYRDDLLEIFPSTKSNLKDFYVIYKFDVSLIHSAKTAKTMTLELHVEYVKEEHRSFQGKKLTSDAWSHPSELQI